MFNLDYEQMAYEQAPSPDFKLPNPTAFTSRNTEYFKTPTPTSLNQAFDHFPAPLDSSMDRDIYLTNARIAHKGILDYFKACISDTTPIDTLMKNNKIFQLRSMQNSCDEEVGSLEGLVNGNQLMTAPQRKEIVRNLQEFQELMPVLIELNQILGREITQEIVYIIHNLLEEKGKQFRSILKKEDTGFILPKIQRFWGNDGEEDFFKGTWQVYEDYDYDEIKKFAAQGVQEMSMRLYFSGKLKYLTLREVKCQLKQGVSVADKFATLIIHLSRNLFINLAGMAQREEEESEIVNELSFYFVEDTLTETLNKKVKRDMCEF